MRILFVSFILAFIGFQILPSSFYSGDMVVHTMFIKKSLDKPLWQNDYTGKYQLIQNSASIYYPLTALATSFIPLTYKEDLRILFFIYLFLFFAGLILVAKKLGSSIFIGILWSFLLLLKFHVGGSAVETIETDFVPRGVSMVLIIWSLYFSLNRKWYLTVILLGFSLLIHVLTGIYAVCMYFIFYTVKKIPISVLSKLAGVVLFIIVLTVYFRAMKIDEVWLAILRMRNAYAFLDTWTARAWFNICLVLVPGSIYLILSRRSHDLLVLVYTLALFTSLFLSVVSLVFTRFYPIQEVIILQLGRSWIFPVYMSLLCTAVIVSRLLKSLFSKTLFLTSFIVFVFIFNQYRFTSLPEDWKDVSLWAKSTEKNCVFLTPIETPGFRVGSERAIVGDYKDGTLSFYSREFAFDWAKRIEEIRDWENLSTEKLKQLSLKYGFNYVVSTQKLSGLDLVYKNSVYSAYSVQSTPGCQII